jgi:hypothetical protein
MVKPITRKEYNKLVQQVKDALRLASTHDPDHAKLLNDHARWLVQLGTQLCNRIDIIERQLERLGAPQYRTVRKGKG